jgi:CO dehydrogenase/acetyl-CoA synthase beta subunit
MSMDKKLGVQAKGMQAHAFKRSLRKRRESFAVGRCGEDEQEEEEAEEAEETKQQKKPETMRTNVVPMFMMMGQKKYKNWLTASRLDMHLFG